MLDAYLDPEGFALKKKKIISSASKRDAETDYDTQGYGGGRSSDMDDLPGSGV